MQIDSLDAYLVRLPLKKPFRMGDIPLESIETVIVHMQSGGVSGWSEVFPGNEPILTAAWSRGVFSVLTECLFPRIKQASRIDSTDRLAELLAPLKGTRHAKATLDMAWWDLQSRLDGKPLHTAIGGTRENVETGLVFDRYDDRNRFLDDLDRAVDEGYRRITLKIRPGWDIQMLSRVRASHPMLMIQCDVEESLDMEKHSDTIYRFDDFMPALLEQPLAASEYVGHAMLQDSLRTTICLDESITTPHQAEIALDLRSAGTFCLKAGKMGGLSAAKQIHDAAVSAEVDCYSGCEILSSLGYRFVLAIASLKGCELPADYVRAGEYFENDPGIPLLPQLVETQKEQDEKERVEHESGESVHFYDENGNPVMDRPIIATGPNLLKQCRRRIIPLWAEPGIGFDPDLQLIESLAVAKASM
ncbi:MAG TPA: hypothetical protein DEB39_13475 [Planctomycetaceae bacterium]|nr:hypothetical protein [Planctomycetaceae bacterium]